MRLRVQILPKPPNHFGVVQLAGRLTLDQETKVQILSPKPILFISGRSADDYTDLPWEQVFAGLNPAAQTKVILDCDLRLKNLQPHFWIVRRRSQTAKALVLETSYCEFDSRRRY